MPQGDYKFCARFPHSLLVSKKQNPQHIAENMVDIFGFFSVSFVETGRTTEDEKEFVFWPLLDIDCEEYKTAALELVLKLASRPLDLDYW